MRYLFFGTPRFANIVLEHLIQEGQVPVALVCNPDRPLGRKKSITKPETKQTAEKHGIRVFQPSNKKELTALIPEFKKLNLDVAVVAAYAHIIEDEVLAVPKKGTLGVHPSLLPKYRGATPIQSVLLNGETESGTTIYKMDAKVDNGPILASEKIMLEKEETYLSLEEKLATLGAKLIMKNAKNYIAGDCPLKEQDQTKATLTKKFKTSDAEVVFGKDSEETIYRKIKALNPEPGVWTLNFPTREHIRVKLLEAELKEGVLNITKIQPDGKKPIRL